MMPMQLRSFEVAVGSFFDENPLQNPLQIIFPLKHKTIVINWIYTINRFCLPKATYAYSVQMYCSSLHAGPQSLHGLAS